MTCACKNEVSVLQCAKENESKVWRPLSVEPRRLPAAKLPKEWTHEQSFSHAATLPPYWSLDLLM